MARHGPVIDLGGTFGDLHLLGSRPCPHACVGFAAGGTSAAQAPGEFAAQFATALDEQLLIVVSGHTHLRVVGVASFNRSLISSGDQLL